MKAITPWIMEKWRVEQRKNKKAVTSINRSVAALGGGRGKAFRGMTKRGKLFAAIRNNNPKAVRFEDACKAAEWMSFMHKSGNGSHVVFAKTGEPRVLNFQNRDGYIYPYQAKQLIEMVNKYGY